MRRLLLTVMAFVTVVGLSSCGLLPGNDNRQADARMQQIADAVNSQDKAALEALFSNRAVERATDLDQGLDYFLSFFPSGGLTWERDSVGSEVDVNSNGRKTCGDVGAGAHGSKRDKATVGGRQARPHQ